MKNKKPKPKREFNPKWKKDIEDKKEKAGKVMKEYSHELLDFGLSVGAVFIGLAAEKKFKKNS